MGTGRIFYVTFGLYSPFHFPGGSEPSTVHFGRPLLQPLLQTGLSALRPASGNSFKNTHTNRLFPGPVQPAAWGLTRSDSVPSSSSSSSSSSSWSSSSPSSSSPESSDSCSSSTCRQNSEWTNYEATNTYVLLWRKRLVLQPERRFHTILSAQLPLPAAVAPPRLTPSPQTPLPQRRFQPSRHWWWLPPPGWHQTATSITSGPAAAFWRQILLGILKLMLVSGMQIV